MNFNNSSTGLMLDSISPCADFAPPCRFCKLRRDRMEWSGLSRSLLIAIGKVIWSAISEKHDWKSALLNGKVILWTDKWSFPTFDISALFTCCREVYMHSLLLFCPPQMTWSVACTRESRKGWEAGPCTSESRKEGEHLIRSVHMSASERESKTLCKTTLIQLLMGSERNDDPITITPVCRRYNG